MALGPRPLVARLAAGLSAAGLVAAAACGAAEGPGAEPGAAPLTLALPDPAAAASCVRFDVEVLRGMSPAFAGTVTAVDDERVVLDVDRWYRGGDAEEVVLDRPDPGSSAALDGVAFEPGSRYLVTAAGGTVNGCGFSGPATPELEAAFAEAFGA